jgi:CRP-like cAMP-binding protein
MKTEEGLQVRCADCSDKSCATAVLNSHEMDAIFLNRHTAEVRRGTNILIEGSPTSHIIYLRSGLIKEYLQRPGKQDQIIQIILPHAYLGLTSLFGDKVNHYSYSALTDLRICYIDIEVFTGLVKSNGLFAYEILTSVGRDSLTSFHRFINMTNKHVYGRMADALVYFSKVIFSAPDFQIPLSRTEIADMIGTTRETTGRALSKFKGDGLIELHGKSIRILDMAKLETISRYG